MTREISPDEQRRLTVQAIKAAGLSLQSVWERYFAITGEAEPTELEAHLYGAFALTTEEADILSHAVNELIQEIPPLPRAPYSTDLVSPEKLRDPAEREADS
ncbi:hypothetical protein [Arthrobacter sp. MDT1-65]